MRRLLLFMCEFLWSLVSSWSGSKVTFTPIFLKMIVKLFSLSQRILNAILAVNSLNVITQYLVIEDVQLIGADPGIFFRLHLQLIKCLWQHLIEFDLNLRYISLLSIFYVNSRSIRRFLVFFRILIAMGLSRRLRLRRILMHFYSSYFVILSIKYNL